MLSFVLLSLQPPFLLLIKTQIVYKIFYLQYSSVVYLKENVSPTTKLFWLVVRIYSSEFKAVYTLYTVLAPTISLKPLHQISLYFLKISHSPASMACYHYEDILNVTGREIHT